MPRPGAQTKHRGGMQRSHDRIGCGGHGGGAQRNPNRTRHNGNNGRGQKSLDQIGHDRHGGCVTKKEGVKLNNHPNNLLDLHRIEVSEVLKQTTTLVLSFSVFVQEFAYIHPRIFTRTQLVLIDHQQL